MSEDKKPDSSIKKPLLTRRRVVNGCLVITATILIGVGLSQLTRKHQATSGPAKKLDAADVVTEDAAQPAETKPDESTYRVPATDPRSITLSSINSHGLVQKVGITKDNAVATPNNVNVVGWYTPSVKPGEDGLSIIDGHVSGKYSEGIFKNLKNLKNGDQFVVEFGNKSTKTFQVVDVKTVPEKDAASLLMAKRSDIPRQLNLITCGGAFNNATQKFADRVIVISKAI